MQIYTSTAGEPPLGLALAARAGLGPRLGRGIRERRSEWSKAGDMLRGGPAGSPPDVMMLVQGELFDCSSACAA